MKKSRAVKEMAKAAEAGTVRASISFPQDIYEALEQIAQKKKVSLAWVVRDAAEMYVGQRNKRSIHGLDK
jgi:metal-responsive CopG/Arc/MetJ family transcriptional regulator